jgi:hypothetical protein
MPTLPPLTKAAHESLVLQSVKCAGPTCATSEKPVAEWRSFGKLMIVFHHDFSTRVRTPNEPPQVQMAVGACRVDCHFQLPLCFVRTGATSLEAPPSRPPPFLSPGTSTSSSMRGQLATMGSWLVLNCASAALRCWTLLWLNFVTVDFGDVRIDIAAAQSQPRFTELHCRHHKAARENRARAPDY